MIGPDGFIPPHEFNTINLNGFETVTVRDDKPTSGAGAEKARFLQVSVTEAPEFEPKPITPDLPQ